MAHSNLAINAHIKKQVQEKDTNTGMLLEKQSRIKKIQKNLGKKHMSIATVLPTDSLKIKNY